MEVRKYPIPSISASANETDTGTGYWMLVVCTLAHLHTGASTAPTRHRTSIFVAPDCNADTDAPFDKIVGSTALARRPALRASAPSN